MRRLFFVALSVGILCLFSLPPAALAAFTQGGIFYPGMSLPFQHLTIQDGLSQNDVSAVLQDSQGYIWIGTQDGLNRYDGYTFIHYRHDPHDLNSISYNNISALFEDADGRLWVGTWGGGLNRYDPLTGKFTHFLPNTNNPASPGNSDVTSIAKAGEGRLWVGTLGGLDLLDPTTGSFAHFRSDPANASTLSSNAISTITPNGDGRFWIGTGTYGTTGAGLNLFDPATGQAERIPSSGPCLKSPNVSTIQVGRDGTLWIGHGGSGLPGGGLDHFSPFTGSCHHYDTSTTHGQFTNDNVIHLLFDRDNRLWVTLWGGGILRMEPGTPGSFASIQHDPTDPESLSSDNTPPCSRTVPACCGWAHSTPGSICSLLKTCSSVPINTARPIRPAWSAIISAPSQQTLNGDMWIGTAETGLARFEPATGHFTYYRNIPSNPASLSSNRIMSLYADRDGTLWVGTVKQRVEPLRPFDRQVRALPARFSRRHEPDR